MHLYPFQKNSQDDGGDEQRDRRRPVEPGGPLAGQAPSSSSTAVPRSRAWNVDGEGAASDRGKTKKGHGHGKERKKKKKKHKKRGDGLSASTEVCGAEGGSSHATSENTQPFPHLGWKSDPVPPEVDDGKEAKAQQQTLVSKSITTIPTKPLLSKTDKHPEYLSECLLVIDEEHPFDGLDTHPVNNENTDDHDHRVRTERTRVSRSKSKKYQDEKRAKSAVALPSKVDDHDKGFDVEETCLAEIERETASKFETKKSQDTQLSLFEGEEAPFSLPGTSSRTLALHDVPPQSRSIRTVPGAQRIGGDDGADTLNSFDIDGDDGLHSSQVDVLARAELVDDPIVAAAVRAKTPEQLMKMRILVGVGLAFVVVVVAILTAVLVPRKSDPTPSPTPAPTTLLEASWINLIQSRMPSTVFDDPTSPQRQALDWMSEDEYTAALVDDDLIVQRFALAVLYYATNGPKWDSHTAGWLNSSSECVWGEPDLDCTEDGVVLEVGLRSDGLSGSLPKEIGLLSTVEWMNLHSNDLAGPIPSEIGQMSSLTHLDIRQSGLVGTIPTELGSLAVLEFLNLRINRLEGTIPTELGKLTVLSRLNLSDNNLSGTIPPVVIVPSLQWVSFKINFDLTGMLPTELGLCNLTVLLVEQTELTGTIAPHLCDTLIETQIDCGEIECDCCLGWNETQNDTHYIWC